MKAREEESGDVEVAIVAGAFSGGGEDEVIVVGPVVAGDVGDVGDVSVGGGQVVVVVVPFKSTSPCKTAVLIARSSDSWTFLRRPSAGRIRFLKPRKS